MKKTEKYPSLPAVVVYCPVCKKKVAPKKTRVKLIARECSKHKPKFIFTRTKIKVQEKFLEVYTLMVTKPVINCCS